MKRRLIKMWSDETASYQYYLQEWWANGWFERLMEGTLGQWISVGKGALHWAQQIALHYNLQVPTEVTEWEDRLQ